MAKKYLSGKIHMLWIFHQTWIFGDSYGAHKLLEGAFSRVYKAPKSGLFHGHRHPNFSETILQTYAPSIIKPDPRIFDFF